MSAPGKSGRIALLILFSALLFMRSFGLRQASANAPINNKQKAHSYYLEAERFARQRLYDEAVVSIGKAIALDPQNPTFHCRKSDFIFILQDDDNEALKEIERAISCTNPPPISYFANKASILERLRRFPEALASVNKVIASKEYRITSQCPEIFKMAIASVYSRRAGIERKMGHAQDAVNDLNIAIKLHPQQIDFRFYRAENNAVLKNWSQVIPDIAFSITECRNDAPVLRKRECYIMLAHAYAELKNFTKATETYKNALRDCPDDRVLITAMKKYFVSIGDKKNAESLQKRIDSLDEDFVPFK